MQKYRLKKNRKTAYLEAAKIMENNSYNYDFGACNALWDFDYNIPIGLFNELYMFKPGNKNDFIIWWLNEGDLSRDELKKLRSIVLLFCAAMCED
jgi:hypothetical protein